MGYCEEVDALVGKFREATRSSQIIGAITAFLEKEAREWWNDESDEVQSAIVTLRSLREMYSRFESRSYAYAAVGDALETWAKEQTGNTALQLDKEDLQAVNAWEDGVRKKFAVVQENSGNDLVIPDGCVKEVLRASKDTREYRAAKKRVTDAMRFFRRDAMHGILEAILEEACENRRAKEIRR